MPRSKTSGSSRSRATQKANATRVAKKQPRGLPTSGLLEIPTDGHHRAGVQLELQKLGSEAREQQLSLFEMLDGDTQLEGHPKPEVAGLDFTIQEDRALTAIQKLLHSTDYEGHEARDPFYSRQFLKEVRLPVLRTTWPEYYEAFGLKRLPNGRFSGKEAADARQALLSLERPFFITFKRHRWEGEGSGRREVVDRIETLRPLLTITKGYKGLELDEDAALDAGEEMSGRATHLLIEVGQLLLEGIEDFYILKPNRLHDEIKHVLDSKRNVSPSVHLFISWLLTKNMLEVKASKKTLAEKLRLGSYVRQRKWKKVEEQLLECFTVAEELGFLDAWEEAAPGVVSFKLNAERCSRIKEQAGHQADIEDEEVEA